MGDNVDITQEMSVETAKNMNLNDIIRLGEVLRRVNKHQTMADLSDIDEGFAAFTNFLDYYNSYRGYLYTNYSLQNSVVGKIKNIISAPSNQILSSIPISVQQLHDGAAAASTETIKMIERVVKDWLVNKDADKATLKTLLSSLTDTNSEAISDKDIQSLRKGVKYNSEKIMEFVQSLLDRKARFSSTNGTGMFKQQYQAAVGKRDVGIGANGLKVFFALSSYYND
jgi:hypothetical protein